MTDTNIGFGTLVDVEARAAWGHEAHDFTPWLADNLDRLSDALGIPLELTGREVRSGRYSADILATNPTDQSVVLIENQLVASDHNHLGQIMTYLAGLDAQVVIWLAPTFREEHLSAISWLNQHTDETFSFFAVKLRVVQIGDSPLAPLFEVIEKPNSWDKSLRTSARAVVSSASPDVAERRDKLWNAYRELDAELDNDSRVGPGASVRWRPVPAAGLVVSRYVSKYGVGIFLRGGRGQGGAVNLPRIEAAAPSISDLLGVDLGNPHYPFCAERRVDWDDPSEILDAAIWLFDQTQRYVAATTAHLQLEDPA